MILEVFLLQTTNQNLLLGFMPESLGLLVFGFALIALTVGLRWVLKRSEADSSSQDVTEVPNR